MFNVTKRTLYGDWDTKLNKFSLVRATSSLGQSLLSAEEASLEVVRPRTIKPSSLVCQSNHTLRFSRVIKGASARVRRNSAASSSAACKSAPWSLTWTEVNGPWDVGRGIEGSGTGIEIMASC